MPVLGLSCYTANLHRYLAGEWDADEIVSRSVRLAVRVDRPDGRLVFSHHEPTLDHLPDGSRLCYTAAESPTAAQPALAAELDRHGRVLVVVDSARLPWSVSSGGPPAPHWLLVDGRRDGEWHVIDEFAALLPEGEQRPHAGWLSDAGLTTAMTLPAHWTPEQELRNIYAFGDPVTVPAGGALWLRRCHDRPQATGPPAGRWLRSDAAVLRHLMGYAAEHGTLPAGHLDDIWAAAGHRSFAYRWRLASGADSDAHRDALETALAQWENLPKFVRLAAESAQRGRPRPVLARATLEALLRAEEDRQ